MSLPWKRSEWVANRADPTQVTKWELRKGKLHIILIGCWAIESTIWFGRLKLHSGYNSWLAIRLWNRLEDRWHEKWAVSAVDGEYYDREYRP